MFVVYGVEFVMGGIENYFMVVVMIGVYVIDGWVVEEMFDEVGIMVNK